MIDFAGKMKADAVRRGMSITDAPILLSRHFLLEKVFFSIPLESLRNQAAAFFSPTAFNIASALETSNAPGFSTARDFTTPFSA